jgi:hypothetical protein
MLRQLFGIQQKVSNSKSWSRYDPEAVSLCVFGPQAGCLCDDVAAMQVRAPTLGNRSNDVSSAIVPNVGWKISRKNRLSIFTRGTKQTPQWCFMTLPKWLGGGEPLMPEIDRRGVGPRHDNAYSTVCI